MSAAIFRTCNDCNKQGTMEKDIVASVSMVKWGKHFYPGLCTC